MTQISILGCGWLGFPLAKALMKPNFLIQGSTTSKEKIPVLEAAGISPFLIELEQQDNKTIAAFLANSSLLIIAIPPKLRNNPNENFVAKIENLLPLIAQSSVEKLIFVSSTSVYGKENGLVSEETKPNPDTEGGRQLLVVEQLLQTSPHFLTSIVRFGGLIGADRNPVRFLSGRTQLENPDAPINLIHQDDCIGIIEKIIASETWGQTFNAVAPFHPTRAVYYTQKAQDLNLALPKFVPINTSKGKIISSQKLIEQLPYCFVKPNL